LQLLLQFTTLSVKLRPVKMKRKNVQQAGFTIVELIIIISFFTVLFSLISFNILRAQRTTSLTSVVNLLVADIKQQQLRAMVGDTAGEDNIPSYGIHFLTDRYILFRGDSYDPASSSNFEVELPPDVVFGSYVSNSVIFSPLSGEIVSYPVGGVEIVLDNLNGAEEEVVEINKYGVIEQN